MREFKFRGRIIDRKEWLYGPLLMQSYRGSAKWYIGYIQNGSIQGLEVDPNTVGQFTGLTDKNGKEIYEDDVYVRDSHMMASDRPYCVRFKHGSWIGVDAGGGWVTLIEGADEPYRDDLFYIEVVGNIHDNQELINAES